MCDAPIMEDRFFFIDRKEMKNEENIQEVKNAIHSKKYVRFVKKEAACPFLFTGQFACTQSGHATYSVTSRCQRRDDHAIGLRTSTTLRGKNDSV